MKEEITKLSRKQDLGHVIMIPNDRTIIANYLNRDFANQISVGDRVAIYSTSHNIIDPDTKELLGKFYLDKDILEITEVMPKYFVCNKVVKTESGSILPKIFEAKSTVFNDTLDINEGDNLKLELENKSISIGDTIRFLK